MYSLFLSIFPFAARFHHHVLSSRQLSSRVLSGYASVTFNTRAPAISMCISCSLTLWWGSWNLCFGATFRLRWYLFSADQRTLYGRCKSENRQLCLQAQLPWLSDRFQRCKCDWFAFMILTGVSSKFSSAVISLPRYTVSSTSLFASPLMEIGFLSPGCFLWLLFSGGVDFFPIFRDAEQGCLSFLVHPWVAAQGQQSDVQVF